MSLVKLLSQYPQYSARKVRRLATQLAYLENINSKEAKGIAEDLMEFNLLQAKIETQMNDDVQLALSPPTEAKQGSLDMAVREQIETVCVTPLAEAIKAINLLLDEGRAYPDLANKARGYVNGSSFFTDRKRVTHEDGSVSVSTAD